MIDVFPKDGIDDQPPGKQAESRRFISHGFEHAFPACRAGLQMAQSSLPLFLLDLFGMINPVDKYPLPGDLL